ncbi:helix-turn-helix transcriptional regulator [uncultured Roseobacter sp.]|uniref:helix-turn-helix domain-containing protein n=1 Tax=uncultured Roseobacter sp. TaxID=114847 RepID=UPI002639FE48|nr:helix-turn-helix transcriptional regulator [uncultured Roseobacter sp.]
MNQLKNMLFAEDPELAESYDRNKAKRDMALLFRSLRKKAGLTQVELAERSGLSQSHISKMEAATGALPEIQSCSRYFHACGARLKIVPFQDDAEEVSGNEMCAVI